jgi:serine/threonine-protein kinase
MTAALGSTAALAGSHFVPPAPAEPDGGLGPAILLALLGLAVGVAAGFVARARQRRSGSPVHDGSPPAGDDDFAPTQFEPEEAVRRALGVRAAPRRETERKNEGKAEGMTGSGAPAGTSAAPAPSATVPSTPDTPRRIGPYRVEGDIGRGAMGMVLRGVDERSGEPVALKTMALGREFQGEALDEARQRFFREAEMASHLQHPDVVAVREAGEDQGVAFIAMELLSGRDLGEHADPAHLLPVPEVLEIVARVARALAYAHRQGLTHRDVKPANIMVDRARGLVKVTDFGIARITDSTQTRTGLVLGTPSFMSPEQLAGGQIDGRSDLYSLGVTLFQLLTGSLPYEGGSMVKLIRAIASETAPDIRSRRPELPQALADVVALALAKHPELRYATGDALAGDLRAVAALMALAPSGNLTRSTPPPPAAGDAAAAGGGAQSPAQP